MTVFHERRNSFDVADRGLGSDNLCENPHWFVSDANRANHYYVNRLPSHQTDPLLSLTPGKHSAKSNRNNTANRNLPNEELARRPMIQNSYSKSNKQSIGDLVRKLNCSSSKKYSEEDFSVGVRIGRKKDSSRTSPNRFSLPSSRRSESTSTSDITRPVMITVKNGEMPKNNQTSSNWIDNGSRTSNDWAQSKSSFAVGEASKASSLRLGASVRKRNNKVSNYFKKSTEDNIRSPIISCDGRQYHNTMGRSTNRLQNDSDMRSAQELARKERWRRGLERDMMKNALARGTKNTKGRVEKDDPSVTDSTSQTTGTSGSNDTAGESSSLDDWTDSTEDSYHNYSFGGSSTIGNCANRRELVRAVTEDAGIIAGFILEDSYACLGTAADITMESVQGCTGDEY